MIDDRIALVIFCLSVGFVTGALFAVFVMRQPPSPPPDPPRTRKPTAH